MRALISGSLAFDTIMVFNDQFKNHILPEQVHILNVSFLVPNIRKEFGGCAGNIAYNLKLLGETPLIMATVGDDFAPYAEWLSQNSIAQDYIKVLENLYTGQAYITTDTDDNQITAFHPGAMDLSHENSALDASDIAIGIVSPAGKLGMVQHAQELSQRHTPFVFDPGQAMPLFNGDELLEFIRLADYAIFNDYEAKLAQQRTGLSLATLAKQVTALIVTHGGKGSAIYTGNKVLSIAAAKAHCLADPTGCGDAYRAGLLYGITKQLDWQTTGQIAATLGAMKIEHHGTQNHTFTLDAVKARYADNFSASF